MRCEDCISEGYPELGSGAAAEAYQADFDEALCRRLGVAVPSEPPTMKQGDLLVPAPAPPSPVAGVLETARSDLDEALPREIELALGRGPVLASALEALERYGAHLEPAPDHVLEDVARFVRRGRLAPVPNWLRTAVRQRITDSRALAVLLNAADRTTLALHQDWFYLEDLQEREPEALQELATILGLTRGWQLKDIGQHLRRFRVPEGHSGPGLQQLGRRGARGYRWRAVRPGVDG